jgi:hypothetical protein
VSEARKEKKGKPDLSLIPYCVEAELARAMMYGEEKYARYDYYKGHKLSDLVSAARRHLSKFYAGEDLDDESGVHHLAHCMANCLMMLHQIDLGTSADDRYKPKPATYEGRAADGTEMIWSTPQQSRRFSVGQRVREEGFGTGTVVKVDNSQFPYRVRFDSGYTDAFTEENTRLEVVDGSAGDT